MLLIESLEEDDFLSCRIAREEGFLHLIRIVLDHGIRSIDDHLGRTIVLIEDDDFRFGIVFLE